MIVHLLMEYNVYGEISIFIVTFSRCSKCADYTTYDTCTGNTGLCYWANN